MQFKKNVYYYALGLTVGVFLILFYATSFTDHKWIIYGSRFSKVRDNQVSYDSRNFTKIRTIFRNVNSSSSFSCTLPVYDYFHRSVTRYLNPMESCDATFKPFTELSNGSWRITVTEKSINCSARCFEGIGGGTKLKFGEWIHPGPVDCEFLETACYENGTQIYGHLHTQIRPPTTKKKKKNEEDVDQKKPNVFIFLLDSMSFGMAKRSFSKTTSYLTSTFQSVEFPFLNVVGENSRPNGFALWFGKRIGSSRGIEDSVDVSLKLLKPDWSYEESCQQFLDNRSSIFHEFKEKGYKTAYIEDWADSAIDSFPFCHGFKNKPTDHYMRPFYTVLDKKSNAFIKSHLNGTNCRLRHHPALEYFQQFLDAYPDSAHSKFSFMWLNDLAHDSLDGVQLADPDFLRVFQKNREILDDSFVILTADHGLRLGEYNYMTTEIGNLERKNPYLSISVPRKFRTKKLLDVLKKNAAHLQTHYDTRATLLDILKFWDQPGTSSVPNQIPGEKGSSLFREQSMDPPRSCETLPIPHEYCICQTEKFKVNDSDLKLRLGRALVDHIIGILETANYTEICVHQEFQEVTSLLSYSYSAGRSFKISVKTKDPGSIHVESVILDRNGHWEFSPPIRLDSYGRTTDCTVEMRQEKMCFCKDFLK